MTNPNDYYVPTTGKTLKTDGTVINVADAFVSNGDGTNSQQVQLTGSYVGYSTDAKPVLTVAQKGYSFLELDTKNIYFWDATKWVLF
jgi:hypothetical protein